MILIVVFPVLFQVFHIIFATPIWLILSASKAWFGEPMAVLEKFIGYVVILGALTAAGSVCILVWPKETTDIRRTGGPA